MKSKVVLKGYIVVSNDDLPYVLNELPNHVCLTQNEIGCLVFSVKQRLDSNNIFDVYEEFVDEASFDAHQIRVKNSKWGDVRKRVERHYTVEMLP